jgi:DNA-directed RNA polymerase subunit beta'
VRINDKHIGCIVRQMLQKVRVTDPGDTDYLEGEHVDRMEFRETTRTVIEAGRKPPRSEPVLLGITKSSLTTESFISAASFQETTRVLTDAAVHGAKDDLKGLKENIIIGHLVPAGTGIHRFQEIEFLVGEPLQKQLDSMRRVEPEPAVPAGGLFAELRGDGGAGPDEDGEDLEAEMEAAESEEVQAG